MEGQSEFRSTPTLLTPEGRSAFTKLSADERRIISWLMAFEEDWPFTGQDIALMILSGRHTTPTQHQEG